MLHDGGKWALSWYGKRRHENGGATGTDGVGSWDVHGKKVHGKNGHGKIGHRWKKGLWIFGPWGKSSTE